MWAIAAVVPVLGEQRPKLPHDVRRSALAASHSLCLSSYHRLIVAEFCALCVIVLEIRCASVIRVRVKRWRYWLWSLSLDGAYFCAKRTPLVRNVRRGAVEQIDIWLIPRECQTWCNHWDVVLDVAD